MVITKNFEVVIPAPTDVVFNVLTDIAMHLSLWSIYDSLQLVGKDEAMVSLRIAGSQYSIRLKVKTEAVGGSKVIDFEGQGDIYFSLRLTLAAKGLYTLITGRLLVKSSFFRERILAPELVSFIDDYRRKLMIELPLMIEVVTKKEVAKLLKEGVVEAPPPEPSKPAIPTPEEKPTAIPVSVKPTPPAPPKEEVKKEVMAEVGGDPRALEDELKLSMLLVKSKLSTTKRVENTAVEVLNEALKTRDEVGLPITFVSASSVEGHRIRLLFKDKTLIGARLELSDGSVFNGREALNKVKEITSKVEWRIYIYEVPPELASALEIS